VLGEVSQLVNFKRLQFAMSTRCEVSQSQWTKRHSFKSQNLVPHASHQSSDFSVLAFLKFQLQNHTLAASLVNVNAAEFEISFGKVHSVTQLIECFRLRNSGHVTTIPTDDFKSRMSQLLCQIAVVCDQQHAFCIFVQTTDGEHALFTDRYQIHSARTALRISVGAEHSLGFIHKEVTKLWPAKSF
jgi:hypothetical protein